MKARVVMLEAAAKPLYWVILAASIVVLLRGHNEPGDGFIGGLMAVAATILWAVVHGPAAAQKRLPMGSARRLAVCGVVAAALSGVPAFVFGEPFLTHLWGASLGFAELKLSTVMVFDLGVFMAVWGALAGYALGLIEVDLAQADEQ